MKNDPFMKCWVEPAMEQVALADTQYGGTTVTEFDNIYQNAEGKWEGTFVPERDHTETLS